MTDRRVPGDRLARSWHTLLPAIVPAESLSYFQQFVDRTAGVVAPKRLG